jgi:hypothetical protein
MFRVSAGWKEKVWKALWEAYGLFVAAFMDGGGQRPGRWHESPPQRVTKQNGSHRCINTNARALRRVNFETR